MQEQNLRDGVGCLYSEKAKWFDMFGQSVGFNYSEKSQNYRSWTGSLATLVVLVITLTLTMQNVIILQNRDRTTIIEALNTNQNDESRIFTQEDGFQMAIALLGQDDSSQDGDFMDIEVEVVAYVEFYPYSYSTFLKLHKCSEEELNFDESGNSKFYPINEKSKYWFETVVKPQLQCFDNSQVELMNDWGSSKSWSLNIYIQIHADKCDSTADEIECIPNEGYRLKMQGYDMVLFQNQHRYELDNYSGETPIVKESVLNWIRFPTRPTTQIYKVKETELKREDNIFMSIESVTEIEEKAFQLEYSHSINKVHRKQTRLGIEIQMNRDVVTVQREVYNSFMLLGDVGGLFGLFVSVFASILGLVNYQKSDNLIVSDLYKTKKEAAQSPEKQDESADTEQYRPPKPSHQSSLIEYLQSCLPSRCLRSRYLRKSKEDKFFERARERLNHELDLVKLLQQLRLFNAALSVLMPREDLESLILESQRIYLEEPPEEETYVVQPPLGGPNAQDTLKHSNSVQNGSNSRIQSNHLFQDSQDNSMITATVLPSRTHATDNQQDFDQLQDIESIISQVNHRSSAQDLQQQKPTTIDVKVRHHHHKRKI